MLNSIRIRTKLKPLGKVVAILTGATFLVGCAVGKDRAEAGTVAARVHDEMRAGDFVAVYRKSAPRFKTVGSESEFVAFMSEHQEKLGVLKNASEITYEARMDSSMGRSHVLVFDLECEHGRARETLIMVRSQNGEMQLWKLGIQYAE